MHDKRLKLIELSEEYFGFMAESYPVMSLSDEFHFFPRANKAAQYLRRLDSLDAEKIKQDIARIKSLIISLDKLNAKGMDLESQIDWHLLRQSMQGYLIEFQRAKTWQNDPNLYLKIIILGVDQIANKLLMFKPNIQHQLASRIKDIPRLLNEAKLNLNKYPLLYQETAIQTANATTNYLKNHLYLPVNSQPRSSELAKLIQKAVQSLEDFQGFLKKAAAVNEPIIKDRSLLEDVLIRRFCYKRSLEEIFEIASQEYQKTLSECRKLAKHIHPTKKWQSILTAYKLKVKNKKELLNMYSTQIMDLKDFLIKKGLITIPRTQNIQVKQTPVYLAPIRASASYSCPLSKHPRESAFFYVGIDTIQENIHQEYIFVTAHETYPGHHLLDSIRRNINNPIRSQIESPLFYEGWASYAERLIDEFGYITNPMQRLIGLRRQAWRAVRAKLDVGIRTKKITPSDAARQLLRLGYSFYRVKSMIAHYKLTYGYQLCYTIGKFEIERLKQEFIHRLGIRNFHNCLLEGGQLPFDLIRKRMEKLCRKTS